MTYREFKNIASEKIRNIYSRKEISLINSALLVRFCGVPYHRTILYENEDIYPEHLSFLFNAVKRLSKNEPLEYVISYAEFYGMKLWVNDTVLIPRPETEEMVDNIIKHFSSRTTPENIIDFGTGSGCIALALKARFTHANVLATDISKLSLMTAKCNAKINNLNVDFHLHDMLHEENLPINTNLDIIVSNPPYVLHDELSEIHERVKGFEPFSALFAPNDNTIAYYLALREYVFRYLKSGGYFIFEVNQAMAQKIKELFLNQNENITNVNVVKDLFGKDRFVSGEKI